MKRALVLLAMYLVLGSCNFAVKHPAATAGIVAGSVALFTCELAIDYEDADDQKTCLIASAAVGLGLTALAAGALWLGSEDEPETTTAEPPPKVDWDKIPDTTPKEPTKAPPGIDAGAPVAPPVDAGAPMMTPDASAPVDAGAPIAPTVDAR